MTTSLGVKMTKGSVSAVKDVEAMVDSSVFLLVRRLFSSGSHETKEAANDSVMRVARFVF